MAAKSFALQGKGRDSYLELVLAFPLASIKSEEHLEAAQHVMDRLLAKGALDKGETTYLDALSDLVAAYEAGLLSPGTRTRDSYCPRRSPDTIPPELLEFTLERARSLKAELQRCSLKAGLQH